MTMMKTTSVALAGLIAAGAVSLWAQGAAKGNPGSRIVRDADVAVKQPGPHDGTGTTTAYPFFGDVPDLEQVFRKRAMHPGSSIGVHEQKDDEIYYVVSGAGEYTLDGKIIPVGPGTALLTRPGSTHGIRQTGKEDLVIFIVYREVKK
jgi:mannose-6-phosphate isomerase-like protein (cupin superfamily)